MPTALKDHEDSGTPPLLTPVTLLPGTCPTAPVPALVSPRLHVCLPWLDHGSLG